MKIVTIKYDKKNIKSEVLCELTKILINSILIFDNNNSLSKINPSISGIVAKLKNSNIELKKYKINKKNNFLIFLYSIKFSTFLIKL
jgi:hypothetical protein